MLDCFVSNDFSDMQPRQRRSLHNQIHSLVNRIVWADEEIRAGVLDFYRRIQHEVGDTLPVVAFNTFDIAGKRMGVHCDLRMSMRTEQLRALGADGAVAERSAFGGAAHNPDMQRR